MFIEAAHDCQYQRWSWRNAVNLLWRSFTYLCQPIYHGVNQEPEHCGDPPRMKIRTVNFTFTSNFTATISNVRVRRRRSEEIKEWPRPRASPQCPWPPLGQHPPTCTRWHDDYYSPRRCCWWWCGVWPGPCPKAAPWTTRSPIVHSPPTQSQPQPMRRLSWPSWTPSVVRGTLPLVSCSSWSHTWTVFSRSRPSASATPWSSRRPPPWWKRSHPSPGTSRTTVPTRASWDYLSPTNSGTLFGLGKILHRILLDIACIYFF